MSPHGSRTPAELIEMRNNWQWQDYFKESRRYLKYDYGLDLTLIEQVHLRDIVQQCFREQKEIEKGDSREYWGFDIDKEAAVRFLNDYYGISYQVLTSQIFFLKHSDILNHFHKQQEREHLP